MARRSRAVMDALEPRRLFAVALVPPVDAPLPPTNLTGVAMTPNKVRLTWADNSSDETRFYGQRSNDPTFATFIAGVIGPNVTKFADISVQPNVTYYYRLRAENDAGDSGWSNVFAITPLPDTLRVNAAGAAYTDSNKNVWSADGGFTGGSISTTSYDVLNTVDDPLYYTRRFGSNFSFSQPVANGSYTLKLFFAEPYWSAAGKRKFNVTAEGATILSNYDIVADVGAQTAAVKNFSVNITDGKLDLNFSKVLDNAIISAVALLPAPPGPSTTVQWTAAPTAPVQRLDSQSAVVGDTMYVFGGFDPNFTTISRNDAYNLTSNTWTPKKNMPEPLSHSGVAVDGTDVWVAGGFIGVPGNQIFGTKHVWKYDTLTDEWTAGPELPQARGAGAMTIIGRELHFFGGSNLGRTVDTGEHWALNLAAASPTWQSRAALPSPRNHLGAATVNGRIYAVGGQFKHDDKAVVQSLVHAYDPATDKWTRVADLPRPRSHITGATFAMNGRLIVIGGDTESHLSVNDATAYNPATETWAALTNLPARRAATAAGAIGTKIFVTGGAGAGVTSDLSWLGEFR